MSYHQFTAENGEPFGSFEVFYDFPEHDDGTKHDGYYWHACFPGCLPDGEAMGPFETEAEAIADADPYRIESETIQT